jgi:hypothetical protein
MNKTLRQYSRWIALGVLVVIVGFLISARANNDALLALFGVVLGAGLTATVQHLNATAERRQQLRLAALDKRLAVHQEAFLLWRQLIAKMHDRNEVFEVVLRCQDWWEHNCLYLTPEARSAFARTYNLAAMYGELLKGPDKTIAMEHQNEIMKTGEIIVRGVELPSLGKEEAKLFTEKK